MFKITETLKVGVVGTGLIGPTHIRGFQEYDRSEVVAVCTRRSEIAAGVAQKIGAEPYTSFHEMLRKGNVDVVSLCTPTYLHAPQTMLAAQYGKHVLVEKPMASTLVGADEMIAVCRDRGVKLGVIYNLRFNPNIQRVKQVIEKGKIGKLILSEGFINCYRSDKDYYLKDEPTRSWRGLRSTEGGGVLINQGIHTVDLLQWIMGPVDSVCGYYDTLTHKIFAEDAVVASIKYRNDALGVLMATTSIKPISQSNRSVIIHGTDGAITIRDVTRSHYVVGGIGGERKQILKTQWRIEGKEDSVLDEEISKLEEPVWAEPQGQDFCREIALFVDAIIEDKDPPITGEEGRKSLEIVKAIYLSSQTGIKVTLPLKGEY